MTARGPNYGWLTTLGNLSGESAEEILSSLASFVRDAGAGQRAAWKACLPLVRDAATTASSTRPEVEAHPILFEYELPRENGRRPDVVLLENGTVVVVEFKGKEVIARADLDQVSAYARDLRNYHSYTHGRAVVPALVPVRYEGPRQKFDDVEVLSPKALGEFMVEVSTQASGEPLDGEQWAQAEYAPLPSLIQAAREIFHGRPLPFIRRAESAGIPQAVAYLSSTAHRAAATRSRHLVLLTGVPGSGKTLAGLQFVHDRSLEDLIVRAEGRATGAPAVFLSGNGPLVRVLRHALEGPQGEEKVFVDGIKTYLKQYSLRKKPRVPPEHIVVFDEAQRAWDPILIEEKHGVSNSEPELVIKTSASVPDWSMVLALIGEGQEIHKGEEGGLAQWASAVDSRSTLEQWTVHAPTRLAPVFAESSRIRFEANDTLDLNETLRSHLASEVHAWVAGLLKGEASEQLESSAAQIRAAGFAMYVTRDLGTAAKYVRERYEGLPDKRYGLLASSQARNLEALGVDNSYGTTRRLKEGPWYNNEPNSPFSCCALQTVATEFAAQGLELDFPIVCWGDDLFRKDERWQCLERRHNPVYRDRAQLRRNSYRVLLTRGRDGFVVFVPPERGNHMDDVHEFLSRCGLQPLVDPL